MLRCLLLRQFLRIYPLQALILIFYVQSKECQKLHWKVAHKSICAIQTEQPGWDTRDDPDEKAQAKKVNRWVNAWSPAMTTCLPIALDLANHPWGRHETHTYARPPTSIMCR